MESQALTSLLEVHPVSPEALWASTKAEALPADDHNQTVQRALEAAREMLEMDTAYIVDVRDGPHQFREIAGDGESFGFSAGESIPKEDTYCDAMLAGRLPNIVQDASVNPVVKDLPATEEAGIGSYVGVPVVLSDGSVYGTFCCLSHAPSELLRARDVRFMHVLARLIGDQLELQERTNRAWREAAGAGTVQALLAALEARDGYTEEHSRAVVELALAVGSCLSLDDEAMCALEWVALLHDVGKIGIADEVLSKPGKLDDAEWAQMRRHPEIGARIVASMPPLAHLAPIVRAEHERWDGCGYPDGLAGEDIPLASRIVLVCDAYHAMTSDRPYRQAMTPERAVEEIADNAGSQFCPNSAHALLEVIRRPTSSRGAVVAAPMNATEGVGRPPGGSGGRVPDSARLYRALG